MNIWVCLKKIWIGYTTIFYMGVTGSQVQAPGGKAVAEVAPEATTVKERGRTCDKSEGNYYHILYISNYICL